MSVLLACLVAAMAMYAPYAWRWLNARYRKPEASAEDAVNYSRGLCGFSLMIKAQGEDLQTLSGDIHACLKTATRFMEENPSRPIGDPGSWVAPRSRLVALAVELDALGLPPPQHPRADTIALADMVRWRNYLAFLSPLAEEGNYFQAMLRLRYGP